MAQTCYRHPNRETSVSCSSCGRPICTACMTPTPVGMRCPECAGQRTRVVRGTGGGAGRLGDAPATFILIGLNALVFLAQIGSGSGGFDGTSGSLVRDFALQGHAVADGEWYRLLSGGFLHAGLLHIGFNMFVLYMLGQLLEPSIGTLRFVVLYFVSLLAGSCGALIATGPLAYTVGASGAIFGIFGASFILARARGMSALASELGVVIALNLVLSFAIPGISVGGHLGGLVGGSLCALAMVVVERRLPVERRQPVELIAMALIGALAVAVALAAA
jgi:membrane associated rhomboid family serine protease